MNDLEKKPTVGRFAEIGAVVVEWGSEAHLRMIHSSLRLTTSRKSVSLHSEGKMDNTINNVAKESAIDLHYRPKQYWTTPDPTIPLLELIIGADKRERAKNLAESFDRDSMLELNEQDELTEQEIQFYKACGLYVFDEEYANPAFLEEPLEIASAGFDIGDGFSDSYFSVSIIVKRCAGQSAFRLLGQGENSSDVQADDTEETSVEDEWTLLEANQSLTLEEVARNLEAGLPHGNVELCLTERWDALDEQTEDTLSLLEISVDGAFYPDISSYFDSKVEKWRQSIRDSGAFEEA